MTRVRTLFDTIVVIPNSKLADSIVTNYHQPSPDVLILVPVAVHAASDLEQVERVTCRVARQIMETVPGGVPGFEPMVRYKAFGDSSIDFWVILRVRAYPELFLVRHEFIKALVRAFAAEGIVIPFPVRAINLAQERAAAVADGGGSRLLVQRLVAADVRRTLRSGISRSLHCQLPGPPHTDAQRENHSRDGGAMFDLLFESFRKASESSMQVPMDMLKNLTQQLPSASGAGMEWSKTFQKRWAEFAIESLNKHRESLDSTYRSGIQLIEQTFRVSDVKSSTDYQKIVEQLWQKLLDVFKEQSESQVRELQTWAAKSFEMQRASA